MDTPNPRTEVDVTFDGLWRVLGIGVCTTDKSDDMAFNMLRDDDLWHEPAHLVERLGIRHLVDSNLGTGCGAAQDFDDLIFTWKVNQEFA